MEYLAETLTPAYPEKVASKVVSILSNFSITWSNSSVSSWFLESSQHIFNIVCRPSSCSMSLSGLILGIYYNGDILSLGWSFNWFYSNIIHSLQGVECY